MKNILYAGGALLLMSCALLSHASGDDTPSPDGDESPPSQINVERPGAPYDFGEYGVVMDDRSPMVLTCSARGDPQPTYEWKYNGGPLPKDDNKRITDEDGVLKIEPPSVEDQGDYQCFATNKHGVALSPKYMTVYAYQDIYEEVGKQSHIFTEGEPAFIECGAPDGAPKPRIYWTDVHNVDILMDDRVGMSQEGNLHFANTLTTDEQNYHCFAANDLLGNYMRSPVQSVTVLDQEIVEETAATIASLQSSVQGLLDEEFKITCLAAGFPTPTISWFKDDNDLSSVSDITLAKFNQELVFSSLSFADAGQYECRVQNRVDPMATGRVHLTVQSTPYFTEDPVDLVLAPGESGEIHCFTGGVPPPTKEWLQNGNPLRDSENSVFVKSPNGDTIVITNPSEGHSTVFQCILENKHGQRVGSYTITILAIPATISEAPTATAFVSEETTLSLKCVAFGSPTPTIEWYKDNVKLEDGTRTSITTVNNEDEEEEYNGLVSRLNVTNLLYDDGGSYECRALNDLGESNAISMITVRLPTSVTMDPATLTVVRGSSAEFTCVVVLDARATDTMTWYFDDIEIHPNKRGSEYLLNDRTLQVLSAQTAHTGTFKCVASTGYDEDSATAVLTVQAEPDAPFNLDLSIEGLEATLGWNAPRDNNADIESYNIEYRTQYESFPIASDIAPWSHLRTVSSASSVETFTLGDYLTYSFRVTATNSVGTSARSVEVQGDLTPSAPPDDDSTAVHIKSFGSEPGYLTISWDPVHPVHHNGPDFEYVIRWWKDGEEPREETISDWKTDSMDINAGSYEDIQYTVGVRNILDDGPDPEVFTGTTGEGRPDAVPSNVQLVAISSSEINVTWDAINEDEVNGAIKSINIYYTMQNAQGSEKVEKCSPDENSCVLGDLQAYTIYEVAVAVENGRTEGDRSLPQTIKTDEGVPSIAKIENVKSTSYRLGITWARPALENGIHIGYHLYIAEYNDEDAITDWQNQTIEHPGKLSYKATDMKPDTKYEVTVTAFTTVGDSVSEKRDTKTGTAGKPYEPSKPVEILLGPDFFNITWKPVPVNEPKPDYVRACYKKEGAESCEFTEQVDVLDTDRILIEDLEEGVKYTVYLEFSNKDGTTDGEVGILQTTGKAQSTGGEALTPWFIAIICIIIFLLLIILIVCILKSQKGGKYNVSDKEKQLKDESAPLKNNDGFAEFNQDSEFPDDVGGSQDSLASHPEGSEGDSLKEYADDEDTGKFNEEGSFIEEYHDPSTRSTDQREGGTSTFV